MIVRRNTGSHERISVYAGGPPMLQVLIYRYGRFLGTECFTQEKILIGRGHDADLCLIDKTISRTHAVLYVHEDGVAVRDLFSSNGTYVNGIPTRKSSLEIRDLLSIGPYVLRFRRHGGRLASATEEFLSPLAALMDPDEDEITTDEVSGKWVDPMEVVARAG